MRNKCPRVYVKRFVYPFFTGIGNGVALNATL